MGLLVDTNVVSAMRVPHRQDENFQRWLRGLDRRACYVSVLTWMELRVGVLKKLRTDPSQGKLLDLWFAAIRDEFIDQTVGFDDLAAAVSAPLWLLRTRGSIDTLIAGTALAHKMPLATRNVTHFADIPGLTLVNPWE